jgi:outer membrane protein assembly factor BamB
VESHDGKLSHASGVPLDNLIFSSPIVAGNSIYIASLDGTVFGVKSATGQVFGYTMTQDRVLSTPCVEDGILYFCDNDGSIYAFGAGPA